MTSINTQGGMLKIGFNQNESNLPDSVQMQSA